ncbi:MAG: hypothetical protein V3V06_03235 [Dehalococcoidia bacterium]
MQERERGDETPSDDVIQSKALREAKQQFEEEFFERQWERVRVAEAPALLAAGNIESPTNIVGLGIGQKITRGLPTGQLCVRVYVVQKVSDEDQIPSENRVPPTVGEIATDVIPVGRPVLRRNTAYLRPLRGGTSVGNNNEVSAGTFGCVVLDKDNSDRPVLLSNNHVLARQNAAVPPEDIVQPGRYDGGSDVIGALVRFELVVDDGITPNLVDAAVAQPVDPALLSREIIGIGEPKGLMEPQRQRWVVKSGRTTGLTRGYIEDVDVTLKIVFGSGVAKFTDQVLIRGVPPREYYDLPTAEYLPPFSAPGDSGSAILDERTGHVVGLLFAGSDALNITYANKIRNVEDKLNVRLPWP